MAKSKNTLTTASVLAFERKLDPSDGLFSAGRWADLANGARWPAISIHEKSVRGTASHRRKTKDQDPAKLDADIESPNLQRVDVATLPPGSRFTTPNPLVRRITPGLPVRFDFGVQLPGEGSDTAPGKR